MTNLEALKAAVGYPVTDDQCNKALADNGLTGTDVYSASAAFSLATAALLTVIATSANISEGGYSVSIADRQALLQRADDLISEAGGTISTRPKVRNKSNYW